MLLALPAPLLAEAGATSATKLDVTYKTTAQGPLKLDLHYPEAPKSGAKYPLVLFTHGGGWSTGKRTIGEGSGRAKGTKALNALGFCVASVDYRLCTKDGVITMRDCVTDSKDALRFLAKNAAQFAVDAEFQLLVRDLGRRSPTRPRRTSRPRSSSATTTPCSSAWGSAPTRASVCLAKTGRASTARPSGSRA